MKKTKKNLVLSLLAGGFLASATVPGRVDASSHREAPFVTEHPKADGTDFYMFRSYESGREGFVTILANYNPLQDAYGGPNYFQMDPRATYDINVDNNGDSRADLVFRFRFVTLKKDIAVPSGSVNTAIPLIQAGQVISNTANLNITEFYTASVVAGGRTSAITHAATGARAFEKPVDNIGQKTFPDYASYANAHIYPVNVPGCAVPGSRMFVGQRAEGFAVNLGEVFDLINFNPLGAENSRVNIVADKNVTTLALELPIACLVRAPNTTFGAWTTASLPENLRLLRKPTFNVPALGSARTIQVSRLANPLINELIIGLKDKDKFNESQPKDDGQFAAYVTNPSLPTLLDILFPVVTPPTTPRNDLISVFITGVDGLNKFGFGEMMRLNTAIAPVAKGSQNNLGVIAGDTAGFPNGRRPGDDVVDITLRVAMGKLLPADQAPSGQLAFTDGATVSDADFPATFPYLNHPNPGSPAN